MQTFVPYSNLQECARVLDRQRLGKQRAETLQVYRGLTIPDYGWRHHPVVKMWAGHRGFLLTYGVRICLEWRDRGYRDTVLDKLSALFREVPREEFALPPWWGGPIHLEHQRLLVRKAPDHYGPLFGA